MTDRLIDIPNRSFFLFGPRGCGKSYLLERRLESALTINLLKSDELLRFTTKPETLRTAVKALRPKSWVWIDEIQKAPSLLDEVHFLMESTEVKFALSGSSARKLKRAGANLLAGRAISRYLDPFSLYEIKHLWKDLVIQEVLVYGLLPLVVNEPQYHKDTLKSYVGTYIREEIKEEGHVRKIEPFMLFLDVASILNAQQLNKNEIAREAQVGRPNLENYFSILVDTLVGHLLPAYQPKIKVEEQVHPKFYWFDPGVARAGAGLLDDPVESEWLGRAMETLIYHELRAFLHIANLDHRLAYYRTKSGLEIDFIIETRKANLSKKPENILIEVKASKKWDPRWNNPMLDYTSSKKTRVKKMRGVYLGNRRLQFDQVMVLPLLEFVKELHEGSLIDKA